MVTMQSISALYEKLIALLPADSPRLLVVYKVAIAIAGFFIIWIILRWLLHFVERRLKKFEFVQANSQVFQLIRRVLLLALLLVVGSYVLRMTQIPLLVKIFHALLRRNYDGACIPALVHLPCEISDTGLADFTAQKHRNSAPLVLFQVKNAQILQRDIQAQRQRHGDTQHNYGHQRTQAMF